MLGWALDLPGFAFDCHYFLDAQSLDRVLKWIEYISLFFLMFKIGIKLLMMMTMIMIAAPISRTSLKRLIEMILGKLLAYHI